MRNIAERTLAFSSKLRQKEAFPSEAAMQEALEAARRRQVLAVVGDAGVGKSSVLELITGLSIFCKTVIPELACRWSSSPGKIHYPREGVMEKYYPAEFLDGIALLETKGANELESSVELTAMLAESDIIVFVVDARNPLEGDAWRIVGHLPDEMYARTVIAVTHEDFFSLEDQLRIKELIREQSAQHFGVDLPLYMLRAGGSNRGQGGEALGRRINSMLDSIALHSGAEDHLLGLTADLLAEQRQVLNHQDKMSRTDKTFLTQIEYEIDSMQRHVEKDIGARLQSICRFVQDCTPRLARKSSRQLGYFLSIRSASRLSRMSFLIDAWFYDYIRKGIEEHLEYHNREFLSICEQHWNTVEPRSMEQIGCEIGEFPREEIRQRLDLYRKRVERALYFPLIRFGIRSCLGKVYAGHQEWMARVLSMMLGFIIVAGVLGSLGEDLAGLSVLLFALLLWFGGSVALMFVKMKMDNQIIEASKDLHLAVRDGLKQPLYDATMGGVADYRKLYINIRDQVAVNTEQLKPLMDEYHSLFYALSVLTRRS